MSKAARVRNKAKRDAAKKSRKTANYSRTGPKNKDGNSKARRKLKGEAHPRPRVAPKKGKKRKGYLGQGVRK